MKPLSAPVTLLATPPTQLTPHSWPADARDTLAPLIEHYEWRAKNIASWPRDELGAEIILTDISRLFRLAVGFYLGSYVQFGLLRGLDQDTMETKYEEYMSAAKPGATLNLFRFSQLDFEKVPTAENLRYLYSSNACAVASLNVLRERMRARQDLTVEVTVLRRLMNIARRSQMIAIKGAVSSAMTKTVKALSTQTTVAAWIETHLRGDGASLVAADAMKQDCFAADSIRKLLGPVIDSPVTMILLSGRSTAGSPTATPGATKEAADLYSQCRERSENSESLLDAAQWLLRRSLASDDVAFGADPVAVERQWRTIRGCVAILVAANDPKRDTWLVTECLNEGRTELLVTYVAHLTCGRHNGVFEVPLPIRSAASRRLEIAQRIVQAIVDLDVLTLQRWSTRRALFLSAALVARGTPPTMEPLSLAQRAVGYLIDRCEAVFPPERRRGVATEVCNLLRGTVVEVLTKCITDTWLVDALSTRGRALEAIRKSSASDPGFFEACIARSNAAPMCAPPAVVDPMTKFSANLIDVPSPEQSSCLSPFALQNPGNVLARWTACPPVAPHCRALMAVVSHVDGAKVKPLVDAVTSEFGPPAFGDLAYAAAALSDIIDRATNFAEECQHPDNDVTLLELITLSLRTGTTVRHVVNLAALLRRLRGWSCDTIAARRSVLVSLLRSIGNSAPLDLAEEVMSEIEYLPRLPLSDAAAKLRWCYIEGLSQWKRVPPADLVAVEAPLVFPSPEEYSANPTKYENCDRAAVEEVVAALLEPPLSQALLSFVIERIADYADRGAIPLPKAVQQPVWTVLMSRGTEAVARNGVSRATINSFLLSIALAAPSKLSLDDIRNVIDIVVAAGGKESFVRRSPVVQGLISQALASLELILQPPLRTPFEALRRLERERLPKIALYASVEITERLRRFSEKMNSVTPIRVTHGSIKCASDSSIESWLALDYAAYAASRREDCDERIAGVLTERFNASFHATAIAAHLTSTSSREGPAPPRTVASYAIEGSPRHIMCILELRGDSLLKWISEQQLFAGNLSQVAFPLRIAAEVVLSSAALRHFALVSGRCVAQLLHIIGIDFDPFAASRSAWISATPGIGADLFARHQWYAALCNCDEEIAYRKLNLRAIEDFFGYFDASNRTSAALPIVKQAAKVIRRLWQRDKITLDDLYSAGAEELKRAFFAVLQFWIATSGSDAGGALKLLIARRSGTWCDPFIARIVAHAGLRCGGDCIDMLLRLDIEATRQPIMRIAGTGYDLCRCFVRFLQGIPVRVKGTDVLSPMPIEVAEEIVSFLLL